MEYFFSLSNNHIHFFQTIMIWRNVPLIPKNRKWFSFSHYEFTLYYLLLILLVICNDIFKKHISIQTHFLLIRYDCATYVLLTIIPRVCYKISILIFLFVYEIFDKCICEHNFSSLQLWCMLFIEAPLGVCFRIAMYIFVQLFK